MKYWEIYVDENWKKWIWLNGAYFTYDDRSKEEIEADLKDYIKNNMDEIVGIFAKMWDKICKKKKKK